jgi:hypothetical protein
VIAKLFRVGPPPPAVDLGAHDRLLAQLHRETEKTRALRRARPNPHITGNPVADRVTGAYRLPDDQRGGPST